MMKKLLPAVFLFVCVMVYGYDINDYPYKSVYDSMFSNVTDIGTITNALDNEQPDMVYSALKRVGQLNIVSAKKKVEALIGESNPAANRGKTTQTSNYRNLFCMGVLVLGKIGDDSDGAILASFLYDLSDPLEISFVIQGIGNLTNSQTALNAINEYSLSIQVGTDARVIEQLILAMDTQNSRSSVGPLLSMSRRVPQSMKELLNETIKKISKYGRPINPLK